MKAQAGDNTTEYHRRICRAIDFINAHLSENPTVAEIARAAPFSSFHFQRLFRAIVGESVAEFTRRVRLETAARRYACNRCLIVGHNFDLPWTQLMQLWLPGSGYQPADSPRFERYHSDGSTDPEGRWDLEIMLPVAPL